MDILSDMEMLQKDVDGRRLTPSSAVAAINQTAKTMESLYKSLTTAKTHLQLKDK